MAEQGTYEDGYEEIGRTPAAPEQSHFETAKKAAQEWAVHILTVAILGLIAALLYASGSFNSMTDSVKQMVAGQEEAKVRGCILLAQSSEVLPGSCLTPDVLPIYAGDVIDALDTTGVEGNNREIICRALDRMGRPDNDC